MLDGKLRIAPTCYHVLHQVPVMTAHEMNFFYDEGLKTADGRSATRSCTDSMVPFGLEKLGISQAMKEKSVDIALDVQSRTVFYQRARGADLYIISGWRNQHTNVWVAPPHIKSLQDLKGKRVGISDFNSIRHWAIQIQLKKAGLDLERDVEWVRIGVGSRLHLDAHPQRQGRVRAGAALVRRRAQEGRLQRTGVAGRSISRRPARAHHRRDRTDSRRAARLGQGISQGDDPLLLVRARHAEELTNISSIWKSACACAVPTPKSASLNICKLGAGSGSDAVSAGRASHRF